MTDIADNTVDTQVLYNVLINLVTVPEDVKIERKLDEQGVLLTVMVNSKDMGIVIGRNGSMATAIKTVMRAVGKANKMNLRLHFLEPDGSIRYGDKENHSEHDHNEHPDFQEQPAHVAHKTEVSTIEEDLSDFVIN
jgi:predicted RNA-binding protein YlqC (UPF0109 family)